MQLKKQLLIGTFVLILLGGFSPKTKAQYGGSCPVTYAEIQEAILRAYEEDSLGSMAPVLPPTTSQRLIEELKVIYIDPRCSGLKSQLRPALENLWSSTIIAEYRRRELFSNNYCFSSCLEIASIDGSDNSNQCEAERIRVRECKGREKERKAQNTQEQAEDFRTMREFFQSY